MGQGNYDHPSYITRQSLYCGVTAATGTATSAYYASPASNLRIRKVCGIVQVAGTGTAGTNALTILNGTSSVGGLAFGTSAAGTIVTSADLNFTLYAGTALSFAKSSADATGTTLVVAEANLDPGSSWTGNG